jgi:hypothetical protein
MNNSCSILLGGLIALAGCQTMATDNDVPAHITNPSDASQAALQHAVNDALNTEVMLAADALTTSSILVIERNPPRSLQSQPATGRNMDMAIQFRLVVNDSDCILIDTRDETRHLLEDTTCAAE